MINVAILGAGIGAQHFEAYASLSDRFDVSYLVDQNEERALEVTAGSTTTVVKEIDTVLNDPEVHTVDICLPPHLHVPVTLAALSHGKHVICEKPIATSMHDVARIEKAANLNSRQVFPVFQYRWGPGLSKFRHLIECGFAGKPFLASVETHWNRGAEYYSVPWRGTWAGEQGGAILGHAIHSHDLLRQIMGPIAAVTALTTTRVNEIETEDCAAVSFEFANGALATSSVTLGAASDETRLRFVFENVTATSGNDPYAPATGSWEFVARAPADQSLLSQHLADAPDTLAGFDGFLSAIHENLTGQKNEAVSLQDGAASIELVTAIYHSARSGARVTLPLGQEHPLYGGWHQ